MTSYRHQFRAFHPAALLAGMLSAVFAATWLDGPLPIPGRSVKDLLLPMAPMALFLAGLRSQATLGYIDEIRHPNARTRRLKFALALIFVAVASGLAAGAISQSTSTEILMRNGIFYIGLALLTPSKWESGTGLLIVGYSLLAWMLGSEGPRQPADAWALPMTNEDANLSTVITALVAIAGTLRITLMRPDPATKIDL